jgi:hypothetical protein
MNGLQQVHVMVREGILKSHMQNTYLRDNIMFVSRVVLCGIILWQRVDQLNGARSY